MKTKYEKPVPGDRFGNLTVVSYYHLQDEKRWAVDLVCDCGNLVSKKRLAHLYDSPKHKATSHCKKCGYVYRGTNKRDYSDSQAKNAVWFNYQSSAKRRGIFWGLSKKDFFNLINLSCTYCGDINTSYFNNPKSSPWAKPFVYTGLDRIDSSAGYLLTNVVTCCKICNRAKSDLSQQDFYNWVRRLNVKIISE